MAKGRQDQGRKNTGPHFQLWWEYKNWNVFEIANLFHPSIVKSPSSYNTLSILLLLSSSQPPASTSRHGDHRKLSRFSLSVRLSVVVSVVVVFLFQVMPNPLKVDKLSRVHWCCDTSVETEHSGIDVWWVESFWYSFSRILVLPPNYQELTSKTTRTVPGTTELRSIINSPVPEDNTEELFSKYTFSRLIT